jgi:hypothetical protein
MRATITVEYEAIDPARPWKWSVDWSDFIVDPELIEHES